MKQWTFLSNHAHVLVCLANDPDATLRKVADEVGMTERATSRIVSDLVREGAIKRTRIGRRNHYEIQADVPLRHPLEQHCSVGQIVRMVSRSRKGRTG